METLFEHLLYEVRDGVCTITLNRPEVLNALNEKLNYEIKDAFLQAGKEDRVRVVVLTGAGRGFCSGADLKAEAAFGGERSLGDAVRSRYNPMILAIRNLPKPVIGRLNGIAAGAGCSLALACDLLIASQEAVMAEIFISIGLVMDAGSTWFLPRLVGPYKAFEMATLGTKVTAQEALAAGLVNRVVRAENWMRPWPRLLRIMHRRQPEPLDSSNRCYRNPSSFPWKKCWSGKPFARIWPVVRRTTGKGVRAFLEKRPAAFTGK